MELCELRRSHDQIGRYHMGLGEKTGSRLVPGRPVFSTAGDKYWSRLGWRLPPAPSKVGHGKMNLLTMTFVQLLRNKFNGRVESSLTHCFYQH